MSNDPIPNTPAQVRRMILSDRRQDESRLAQAKRRRIPESSLRDAETSGRLPRNATLRRAFLKAFGVKS